MKDSISTKVPSWNFVALTRPDDSMRIYLRVKDTKNKEIKTFDRPVSGLISVPYSQLKAEAEEIVSNRNSPEFIPKYKKFASLHFHLRSDNKKRSTRESSLIRNSQKYTRQSIVGRQISSVVVLGAVVRRDCESIIFDLDKALGQSSIQSGNHYAKKTRSKANLRQ